MVGIEKDGRAVLVSYALDYSGRLADSHELALAFGDADEDREVQPASCFKDGPQGDEIGNVEMAYSGVVLFRFRQGFAQARHASPIVAHFKPSARYKSDVV